MAFQHTVFPHLQSGNKMVWYIGFHCGLVGLPNSPSGTPNDLVGSPMSCRVTKWSGRVPKWCGMASKYYYKNNCNIDIANLNLELFSCCLQHCSKLVSSDKPISPFSSCLLSFLGDEVSLRKSNIPICFDYNC